MSLNSSLLLPSYYVLAAGPCYYLGSSRWSLLWGHLWPMTNSTIQIQWRREDQKAGEPNYTASSKNKNCILFNKTSFAYPLQGIYHERTKEWFNPLLISAPNWLDAASCVSFYLHIPSCPFLVQIISRFLVQCRVVEYFQDAHFTFSFAVVC